MSETTLTSSTPQARRRGRRRWRPGRKARHRARDRTLVAGGFDRSTDRAQKPPPTGPCERALGESVRCFNQRFSRRQQVVRTQPDTAAPTALRRKRGFLPLYTMGGRRGGAEWRGLPCTAPTFRGRAELEARMSSTPILVTTTLRTRATESSSRRARYSTGRWARAQHGRDGAQHVLSCGSAVSLRPSSAQKRKAAHEAAALLLLTGRRAIDPTAPAPDEVEISVFGRGFGEAICIHVDGEWIVVDSCLTPEGNPLHFNT
jgi:hypothetical protein